jgi:hypothetical protein
MKTKRIRNNKIILWISLSLIVISAIVFLYGILSAAIPSISFISKSFSGSLILFGLVGMNFFSLFIGSVDEDCLPNFIRHIINCQNLSQQVKINSGIELMSWEDA